jgi:phage gpG-like protein
MSEAIEGLDRLLRRVSRLETRITGEIEKPFKAAGTYMIGSIQRNFTASGRPAKWQALAASTIAQRRRGKGRGGVKPLIDTGRMKNSESMRVGSKQVEVGTNMVQAKRQHFGYPEGTGRGHSKTPARPFMMIQDPEDYDAIKEIFSRHIRS